MGGFGGAGRIVSTARAWRAGFVAALVGLAWAKQPAASPPSGAGRGWGGLVTELLPPLSQDAQLPQSSIPTALATDGRGFLWVGSQNGLARLDGRQFRIFNLGQGPGSLPDSQVEVLHVDPRGRLWVGTLSGGLARYDARTDRFETYSTDQDLSHVGAHALADSEDGGLWIGTETGLDEMSGATRRVRHAVVDGPARADVRDALAGGVRVMRRDRSGALWVGTSRGLLRHDARSGEFSPVRLGGGGEPHRLTR